jgi:DNA-binding NarL/FixJ family response regulator
MASYAKPTRGRTTTRQMTTRERQILELLASGMTQSQVAKQLLVSRQFVSQVVATLRERGAL